MNLKKKTCICLHSEERYRIQKIKRAWLVETRVDGKQPEVGGRCDLRL